MQTHVSGGKEQETELDIGKKPRRERQSERGRRGGRGYRQRHGEGAREQGRVGLNAPENGAPGGTLGGLCPCLSRLPVTLCVHLSAHTALPQGPVAPEAISAYPVTLCLAKPHTAGAPECL